MNHRQTLEERVAERYSGLSGQLQKAADYVVTNPLDIASRSLRAISSESNVSPATFSRLSRALGFDTFEEMKDVSRLSVGQQVISMSEKAEQLRVGNSSGKSMLQRQSKACINNIESFVTKADEVRLEQAAASLRNAKRVVLLGALASTGMTEYMGYLAHYFAPNWTLAGRMGASLGSQIATLGAGDALFIVTKSPYAKRAVQAAEVAKTSGADVVLVTDSHKCPGLAHATYGFVVPSESPQFFSSYVVTLVLIETLIAMIVATSGADATAAIRRVEAKNQELGEYWSEPSFN
ncbi:MurR/RpiR family transcriptional regulator [uncultured Shimia sp.]|uniref:MurR/RpiR family transcriptional regulator n=1 Tax=uncultured Shimia sp. TaxID=573152 RepID=UPI002609C71A|nr:MurR/RpiR family transcriptional regulator [uncultured Shimia sp.]